MDARTNHHEEIAQDRELIRRSRALVKVTKKLIATSEDRLAESLQLLRTTRTDKAARN